MKKEEAPVWEPYNTVSKIAPKPSFHHPEYGKPNTVYDYFTDKGSLAGHDCRFDLSDGKKAVIPYCFGCLDGREDWYWKHLARPTPLYGLPDLLSKPDAPVLILEGGKSTDAAKKMFHDYVCLTSIGGAHAARFSDWSSLKGRSITFFRDNDEPGIKYQNDGIDILKTIDVKEIKIVRPPENAPKGWDVADEPPEGWNHDKIKELVRNASPIEEKTSDWPLKPLPAVVAVPEDIPEDMIPSCIRAWVKDEVARLASRLASFVAVVISAVAIVIGKKITICPKQFDTGWKVALSWLWTALIGRSGSKKNPSISSALVPLYYLERKAREKYDEQMERNEPKISALESAIDGIKKRISEASKAKKISEKLAAEDDLKVSIAKLKELKTTEHRYTVQDSTVEKFGMLLAENQNGLGVVFDEMIGWIKGLERKGHEAARAFYLKSHNGTQDERVDRVTRESLYIPHLYAVIIGGIQPDGFNQYIREAVTGDGSGADGMIQRFQLALVHTLDGSPSGEDRIPNEFARKAVIEIFKKLDSLTRSQLGLQESTLPHVHFSDDAQLLFNSWHEEHQKRLHDEDLHHVVESHFSKQGAIVLQVIIFQI